MAGAGVAWLCASVCLARIHADPSTTITAVLEKFAKQGHEKWNMSVAVAFFSPKIVPDPLAAAAGFTNQGLLMSPPALELRAAQPDDIYVWGSTTKMFTGPAVLQLVDQVLVC
jgi:CubicO group peptidase (beta-lactamase class C family)